MPGPYGHTTFNSPNPLAIEVAILEIIDNSIDAGATRIDLKIQRDAVKNDSLEIRVYDNGTKVEERNWTEEDIRAAFEIEIDPHDPEVERDPESIGKFHVGMKIAPLTKFNFISMFTMSGETLLQMHGIFPENDMVRNQPSLIYGGEANPTPETPNHIEVERILNYFNANEMNTCVMMSSPRVPLLPSTTDTDYSCLSKFRLHMKNYLGLVYQKHLEEEAVSITVNGISQANGGPEVIALDPFWTNFTPEKILAHRDQMNREERLEEGEFDQLTNLSRFGTLKTPRIPIEIYDQTIYVEGFLIPHRTVRHVFLEYWEDGNYDDDQTIVKNSFKISNSGSEKLAGTNLSGFFFYRGKRCINFGGDLENNQGFYDLISPQQKNWVYRLRVKIEYSERVLDHKFELHPNKKGYIDIDDEIWNQIKLALSVHIGGNQFARPFSQPRAFVLWEGTDNQFCKTEPDADLFSYQRCRNCTLKIHERIDDICPLAECPQCNTAGIGCSAIQCNYVCTFCNNEECPGEAECELNCEFCNETIMHADISECVNYCDICEGFDCNCNDEEVPEPEDEPPEPEGEPRESEINIYPNEHELELLLVKQNKDQNIELLNEALDYLEISPDEL